MINTDELDFVKKLQIHIVEMTRKILEMLPVVTEAYKDHLDEFITMAEEIAIHQEKYVPYIIFKIDGNDIFSF